MDDTQTPQPAPDTSVETTPVDSLVETDELIEEVSIDGMCGVY
ncbi:hypothetical protein AMIS_27240 [Actinoplanes missouriensis 431]|uniref:Mycofactocin n=1 Tax=Actinoplanes missouriensis (strain ATCC 14538 / DSM 43046 / CBS 188.64 / JCM 3121 / NBRC 102363 / NCIMB 12654 / NRRL B-3342 / UNCC 431) TaxID=512565 RepID=I0H4K7_ACTM4|nr:mycofactocin precursor MftA [Actinoplanes missouriensis]BAL87944.1 hypothetical protein AMIS_27240 [Actinoplanes missouriensis 431]